MRSACPTRSRIRTHFGRPMQLFRCTRSRSRARARARRVAPFIPLLLLPSFATGLYLTAPHTMAPRLRQLCCITPGASPSCPLPPFLSFALSLFLFLFFSRHSVPSPVVLLLLPLLLLFFLCLPSRRSVFFSSSLLGSRLRSFSLHRRPGAPCVSHIYAPCACLPPRKKRTRALLLLLLLLRSR